MTVSYSGSKGRVPLWISCGLFTMGIGAYLYTLPHFLFPSTASKSHSNSEPICSVLPLENVSLLHFENNDKGVHDYYFMPFFICAQFLIGAGSSPILTLAPPFIDDHVTPSKAPAMIASIYAAAALGPVLGYALGAFVLQYPADLFSIQATFRGLTPDHIDWIGAWWTGYILLGSAIIIGALILAFFPRKLRSNAEFACGHEHSQYRDKLAQSCATCEPYRDEKSAQEYKLNSPDSADKPTSMRGDPMLLTASACAYQASSDDTAGGAAPSESSKRVRRNRSLSSGVLVRAAIAATTAIDDEESLSVSSDDDSFDGSALKSCDLFHSCEFDDSTRLHIEEQPPSTFYDSTSRKKERWLYDVTKHARQLRGFSAGSLKLSQPDVTEDRQSLKVDFSSEVPESKQPLDGTTGLVTEKCEETDCGKQPNDDLGSHIVDHSCHVRGLKMVKKKGRHKSFRGRSYGFIQNWTKDIPLCIYRLLCNRVYIVTCLCICCEMFLIIGFAGFLPKYLEIEYHVSKSTASVIAGGLIVPAGSLGILVGGLILNKARFNQRSAILFVFFVNIFILACTSAFFFLGCDNPEIAGFTAAYPAGPFGQSPMESSADQLDSFLFNPTGEQQCFSDCNCDSNAWHPACHTASGVTFFSPCYAGCSRLLRSFANGKKIYSNCSCLSTFIPHITSLNGSDHSDSFTPLRFRSTNESAFALADELELGRCPLSCTTLIPFICLLTLALFLTGVIQNPLLMVTMRSVRRSERSIGLGLQFFIIRLIANLPSPIAYGRVIDGACLFWREEFGRRGGCAFMDLRHLTFYITGLSTVIKGGSLFIYLLLIYLLSSPAFSMDNLKEENSFRNELRIRGDNSDPINESEHYSSYFDANS